MIFCNFCVDVILLLLMNNNLHQYNFFSFDFSFFGHEERFRKLVLDFE